MFVPSGHLRRAALDPINLKTKKMGVEEMYLQGVHPLKLFARRFFSPI